MKRKIGIGILVIIIIVIIFYINLDNNTIEYNGSLYNVSDLSEETIEWLEWYNSLTEEDQKTISYIPPDLLRILLEEDESETSY